MPKFKKVFFVFLGVYLFAALSLVGAQNVQGADEKHMDQHIREVFSQLNLSDNQKQQLEVNKKQHRSRMEDARRSMKVNKDALQQELMKPTLDMSKINAIHEQIKLVQSQIEDEKLSSILAVRSILTPEQFIKFISLIHKHKPEHSK